MGLPPWAYAGAAAIMMAMNSPESRFIGPPGKEEGNTKLLVPGCSGAGCLGAGSRVLGKEVPGWTGLEPCPSRGDILRRRARVYRAAICKSKRRPDFRPAALGSSLRCLAHQTV